MREKLVAAAKRADTRGPVCTPPTLLLAPLRALCSQKQNGGQFRRTSSDSPRDPHGLTDVDPNTDLKSLPSCIHIHIHIFIFVDDTGAVLTVRRMHSPGLSRSGSRYRIEIIILNAIQRTRSADGPLQPPTGVNEIK